ASLLVACLPRAPRYTARARAQRALRADEHAAPPVPPTRARSPVGHFKCAAAPLPFGAIDTGAETFNDAHGASVAEGGTQREGTASCTGSDHVPVRPVARLNVFRQSVIVEYRRGFQI